MQERPMRFHWFWSHISMFLGILSGLFLVVQVWGYRAVIHSDFLWTIYFDTGFGILYSIVCLCAFINRNKRTLTAWHLLLAPPLLNIAYSLALIVIYSEYSLDTTQQWGQVIGFSIGWVLTFIYYQKRKPLFNNYISSFPHEINDPQHSEIPSRETDPSVASEELRFKAAQEHEQNLTSTEPEADQPFDLDNSPVSTPSRKYCDNCGTECENWVKFCPVCGCKTFSVWIKKPLHATSDPALQTKTDMKVRKYLFKKRIPLIALAVLCVALAAVSSVLYINLQNALSKNAEIQDEANELSTTALQLREKNANLEDEIFSLKLEKTRLTISNVFFNKYIGFIVDGSDQYHTYECEVYKSAESFTAHNVEYCKYLGYTAHSCWDK